MKLVFECENCYFFALKFVVTTYSKDLRFDFQTFHFAYIITIIPVDIEGQMRFCVILGLSLVVLCMHVAFVTPLLRVEKN